MFPRQVAASLIAWPERYNVLKVLNSGGMQFCLGSDTVFVSVWKEMPDGREKGVRGVQLSYEKSESSWTK